jgi:hypothetical protein
MTVKAKILPIVRHRLNLYPLISLTILTILLNVVYFDCIGQITFIVSQPQLSISDDGLMIAYDILSTNPNDRFNIWLEITDSSGVEINAYTLKGDIGDSIKAGVNKQIMWNLYADSILINNTVNVTIVTEKIIPEIVSEEKDLSKLPSDMSKEEDIKLIEEPVPTLTKVKVGNNLLKSALFPGWGLTTLSKGKPYWLMGVVGIGCIGTSIYYNQKANSSYDNYLNSTDDNVIPYRNDAIKQDKISKVFGWSAVVIWFADLGIVTIKAVGINKSYRRGRLGAFSISPCIDLNTYSPVLSIYYNFSL